MAVPGPDPIVDVVILTWNDGELLAAAIASVERSEAVDARIIVVDNGSEPPAAVHDRAVTLIRLEANRGVAAGRNIGIRNGTSDLICLLDSDAELGPRSLRNLVDELSATGAEVAVPCFGHQAPTASAGAAPGLADKVARVLGRTGEYRALPRKPDDADVDPPSWPVDFGIGACQLFRRPAYDRVGGIDETFFYGPEDVDFCLRVKQSGGTVIQVAGHPVHHPPRRIHRRPITRRGLAHTWAVLIYYRRHHRWLRTASRREAGAAPERPELIGR